MYLCRVRQHIQPDAQSARLSFRKLVARRLIRAFGGAHFRMTNKHGFRVNSLNSFRPEKLAGNFSAQELARFQEEFKPLAETYNAKLWTVIKLVALLLLCLVPFCVSIAYSFSYGYWLFGVGIMLCFVGIVYFLLTARIRCTACQADLDAGLGAYCPECGGELSDKTNSKVEADCVTCGAKLRFIRQPRGGRVRGFKIRSCSYCGVRLHEGGV